MKVSRLKTYGFLRFYCIFICYRRFTARRTLVRLSRLLVFAKDRIRSLGFALKSPMRFGEEQSALAHLQENLQIRFV